MRVSVITPTADRQVAFRQCEEWMARQTRQPDEWIVADGGSKPVVCSRGQRHLLSDPIPRGAQNFLRNLTLGIEAATGDVLVFIEDDDWEAPTHLADLCEPFTDPTVLASGDDLQVYYNLPRKLWRTFNNKGASLCQTAIRRDAVQLLLQVIATCQQQNSFGVDGKFWAALPKANQVLRRTQTVVGIKGLPGGAGLGIGHRPDHAWTRDPNYRKLRELVGVEDAAVYEQLMASQVCA